MPRSILQDLGTIPTALRKFVLANGYLIDRDIAWITIRFGAETSPTICVFGDDGTESLLGVVTLEEFALAADPVNGRLVPMPRPPLLTQGSREKDVAGWDWPLTPLMGAS